MSNFITHNKDGSYMNQIQIVNDITNFITLNNDGSYMDQIQIVNNIMNNDRLQNVDEFKKQNRNDLILFHNSLGMWIRNNYGLWLEDYALNNDEHPDDYSFVIIQMLHDALNSTNVDPNSVSIPLKNIT